MSAVNHSPADDIRRLKKLYDEHPELFKASESKIVSALVKKMADKGDLTGEDIYQLNFVLVARGLK